MLAKDGGWTINKLEFYNAREARAGWGKDIPELLANANWNYSAFLPDKSPITEINQATCLACHKAQEAVSYLFTFQELADHARAR